MKYWKVVNRVGKENVAWVYLLSSKEDEKVIIECVEAFDPRYPAKKKWVIILSSQKGCPVRCRFCDASFYYAGNLNKEELLEQLEIVLAPHKRGDDCLHSEKIKLHFARMGDPAFNDAVLELLEELPAIYSKLAFIPTVATIAPEKRDYWFERLKMIKDRHYDHGRFQLQFSMNSTDKNYRDWMMPFKKWSFEKIRDYGQKFYNLGDRKITLNYALAEDTPFEADPIMELFDSQIFLVKITPLNPTSRVQQAGMKTALRFDGSYPERIDAEIDKLERCGFEVILSIGSLDEIEVSSNCGQIAWSRVSSVSNL